MTPIVCMVTALDRLDGSIDALVRRVGFASRAGVSLVQVREPALDGRALTDLVKRCLDTVERNQTRVVVNDRLDVALATGAHGVHLRGDSIPAERVRSIAPPGFLIGRSVHGAAEASTVTSAGGLDYLIAGTIFASRSKPSVEPVGATGLAAVVEATTLPVLAIGGISTTTAASVAQAGASGFAAIDLFATPDESVVATTVADAVAAFRAGAAR